MSADVLNIVVPMAGHGSRFAKAGYKLPKPLLTVHGRPMIDVVIDNLRPTCDHQFIFICQKDHIDHHNLGKLLGECAPGCIIIALDEVTEGAACTVLLAEDYINNGNPLMVANCDQYISVSMDDYLKQMDNYDGFIMTMTADDPKWSFVRFGDNNDVIEVVEKEVVSNEATVGIYNYKHGSDFVKSVHRMIANEERVNGEFYVAPAYNQMIKEGMSIGVYNIGEDRAGMYGLGIPDDLTFFNSLTSLP